MKHYLGTEIATTAGQKHAKNLVHQLYADEKYRNALRFIVSHKPITHDLLKQLMLRVDNALNKRPPYLAIIG
jgi:hypothetical protein